MERVGFVGLGTMGAAMAANIARAGFPLTVWNRTPGRAAALVELGAAEAASPTAVAAAVDIVVACVSDTPDVEAVLPGPDGVAEGARPGTLVVDCSTISPSATRDIAERLGRAGVRLIDAPLSGQLGPGLLESAYEECLCEELSLRKVPFGRQIALPVTYKNKKLDVGYRIDLLANNEFVVELKTVDAILPIHEAQILTYMRLGGWQLDCF